MEKIYIAIEGTELPQEKIVGGMSRFDYSISSNIEAENVPLFLLFLAKQYYKENTNVELLHQFKAAETQEDVPDGQMSFDL